MRLSFMRAEVCFENVFVCLRLVKDSCWHLSNASYPLSSSPAVMFSCFITEGPVIFEERARSARAEVGRVIRATGGGLYKCLIGECLVLVRYHSLLFTDCVNPKSSQIEVKQRELMELSCYMLETD